MHNNHLVISKSTSYENNNEINADAAGSGRYVYFLFLQQGLGKCRFAPPFHDDYSIEAFSEETFIGASLGTFKFYHIPYEMLGQTIDLTKKTDYPLSFSVGYQDFSWHSSPDDIGGAIHDEMTFEGESPFKSGTMLLEETENCITFTLKGKLKDGSTIRMKLVAPAEK